MNRIAGQFQSIEQVTGQYFSSQTVNSSEKSSDISFESVLRQAKAEAEPLKFSKHASMRLMDRNIQLSESQTARLKEGVVQAGEKGIHDSLVLIDSLAFIVNVPNRTVVTALSQEEATNNVFTNIDGAVIN